MKYHTSTYTPPHFNLLYSTSIIYEEKNFDLNCHTSTYSPHIYIKYRTATYTIYSKAIPHLRYTVHEIPHLNKCTTLQSTIPHIRVEWFLKKNLGTCHVVVDCSGTSNPKFYFDLLWQMPDSNPGPLPQKSDALPMSHHIREITWYYNSIKKKICRACAARARGKIRRFFGIELIKI